MRVIAVAEICNLNSECDDHSDEEGCEKCDDSVSYQCLCFKQNITQCPSGKGCIPKEKLDNGVIDCPDGTDEPPRFYEHKQGIYVKRIYRFHNFSECYQNLTQDECDKMVCYKTIAYWCIHGKCDTMQVICTSCSSSIPGKTCDPKPAVQCTSGWLILAEQFCDGQPDCDDYSDEIRYQDGFKCGPARDECILPHANVFDDVAQCESGYDLCNESDPCFECLDGRLVIASEQLCNGNIDCHDMSDECLCGNNVLKPNCDAPYTKISSVPSICPYDTFVPVPYFIYFFRPLLHSSLLFDNSDIDLKSWLLEDPERLVDDPKFKSAATNPCNGKYGPIFPILCDGNPECTDYDDECSCDNPPSFCTDKCFSFYPMGDRVCDGLEDEAWKFINDSSCPRGFDEQDCPDRFKCVSGNRVSILAKQVCDGKVDCDDKSDEHECSGLFSSDTEMIANLLFRCAFWIIGFVVIIGNVIVFVSTVRHLKTSSLNSSLQCQHVIILNIAIADFIMGVYLITIAIFSQVYSGYYGLVDVEWRTSLRCSFIGSLVVISSQASCFLMIVLSAYRLYTVANPYATVTINTTPWKMAFSAAWLFALVFALVPIPHRYFDYFVENAVFSSQFSSSQPKNVWKKEALSKFACRFAVLKNLIIDYDGSDWNTKRSFLEKNFPGNFPLEEFGYYGETSICMPRFFVATSDSSWQYTLVIITINFLAFLFIVSSYVSLYIKFKTQRREIHDKNAAKQEKTMQRRIARILATDFACWIPLCIMSYVRISGYELSSIVYQVSAVFLLPINSALNPFLYSSIIDKMLKKLMCNNKQ